MSHYSLVLAFTLNYSYLVQTRVLVIMLLFLPYKYMRYECYVLSLGPSEILFPSNASAKEFVGKKPDFGDCETSFLLGWLARCVTETEPPPRAINKREQFPNSGCLSLSWSLGFGILSFFVRLCPWRSAELVEMERRLSVLVGLSLLVGGVCGSGVRWQRLVLHGGGGERETFTDNVPNLRNVSRLLREGELEKRCVETGLCVRTRPLSSPPSNPLLSLGQVDRVPGDGVRGAPGLAVAGEGGGGEGGTPRRGLRTHQGPPQEGTQEGREGPSHQLNQVRPPPPHTLRPHIFSRREI